MNELKMRMPPEPEERNGNEVVDHNARLHIEQCAIKVQASSDFADIARKGRQKNRVLVLDPRWDLLLAYNYLAMVTKLGNRSLSNPIKALVGTCNS